MYISYIWYTQTMHLNIYHAQTLDISNIHTHMNKKIEAYNVLGVQFSPLSEEKVDHW